MPPTAHRQSERRLSRPANAGGTHKTDSPDQTNKPSSGVSGSGELHDRNLICISILLPAFIQGNETADAFQKSPPLTSQPMKKLIPLLALFTVCSAMATAAEQPLKPVSVKGSADEKSELSAPDIQQIIALYQRLTRKKIVYDNSVQGPINLDIAALPEGDKAIELIERTLFANGFSLVDVSSDSIQLVGLARNPRTIGVPAYSKASDLPKGERVVTYIFKIQHRDAAELGQLLQCTIAPSIYTFCMPDSKTGTIVLTERTSVIRSLMPIVEALDAPKPAAK